MGGDVEETPAKESHSSKRSKQEKPEGKSKEAKRSKRQAGNYFNPLNYQLPALSPMSTIPARRHHKTVVNVDVIGKRSVHEESPVNAEENHFLF